MKLKNVIFVMLIGGLMCVIESNAQTTISPGSSGNQTTQSMPDKPLKIIKKMFSGLRSSGCAEPSGIVSVRATFDKSAKITETELVKSSGCDEFDRNALIIAKKIKFEPAIKNGEAITTTKIIQYSFNRY